MQSVSLCLWTCAAALAAAASGERIETVRNSGFEADASALSPWTGSVWEGKATLAIDREQARSGRQSLRLTGFSKGLAVVQQRIKYLGGAATRTSVTLEGWWRARDVRGTGARVVLRFLDDRGKKAGKDAAPLTAHGTFAWKPFSMKAKVPPGTVAFVAFLELWRSEGTVWYDDISLKQELPALDVVGMRTGAGGPPPIRVAVYDADSAGGLSYGETGILTALAGRLETVRGTGEPRASAERPSRIETVRRKTDRIVVSRITQLAASVLFDFDVLILPDVHSVGLTPSSDFAGRTVGIGTDWRANVRAFVAAGGGVLLTHDGVGGRMAFDPPLFPRTSHSGEKVRSVRIARVARHPVTEGLGPFVHAFPDHMACRVGKDGTPILWDAAGRVVGVVSEGAGRVCAVGICIGLGPGDREAAPIGAERRLLVNAVKWLAGGRGPNTILCASPYFVRLDEAADNPTFSLTVLARNGTVDARRIKTFLLDSAGKPVAQHVFSIPAAADGVSRAKWRIDVADLPDGTYRLVTDTARPRQLASLELALKWERLADNLPHASFQWKALNCHVPSALKTPGDCIQMVRRTKAMGFDALLFDAKMPGGRIYYRSKIGRPEPVTGQFDPLEVTAEACRKAGVQCLAQFCTFSEGRQTVFFAKHPEWAAVNLNETPDYRKQKSVFGCPDRPEVRAYELALIREILTRYPVDGISFDYIRYKNDYACYCEYSERTLRDYMQAHPGLSEEEARARRSRETIVGFTRDVRQLADSIRPGLILHAYTHPVWANQFPLQYHSQRASAHGKDPARGGGWSLQTVYEKAKFNVDIARQVLDYPVAAPMADTAYSRWAKSPERFRRELRLISHAGAKAVMVYLYNTLRRKPGLRAMIAEEFGGDPREATK